MQFCSSSSFLPSFLTDLKIKSYPSKLLKPVLHCLLSKAYAPFKDDDCPEKDQSISVSSVQTSDPLSYFPLLYECRTRGKYTADREGQVVSCNKKEYDCVQVCLCA